MPLPRGIKSRKGLRLLLSRLGHFLRSDIWRLRANELSRARSWLVWNLRIVALAVRGFAEDQCKLRASALTFYSLLSIVPVASVAFGVAKGFGLEQHLEAQIRANLKVQEEVVERVIEFSGSLLGDVRIREGVRSDELGQEEVLVRLVQGFLPGQLVVGDVGLVPVHRGEDIQGVGPQERDCGKGDVVVIGLQQDLVAAGLEGRDVQDGSKGVSIGLQ